MKGIGGLVERGTCRLREALAGRLGSGPLARGEAASRGRLVGPAIPFEGQSSCPMMRSRERESARGPLPKITRARATTR
jgi:hypothetical protein